MFDQQSHQCQDIVDLFQDCSTASMTSMPSSTCPMGLNQSASSLELLARLTKSWVVRVFGPLVVYETRPYVLDSITGSSGMVVFHLAVSSGCEAMPNWTTKSSTVRAIMAKNVGRGKKRSAGADCAGYLLHIHCTYQPERRPRRRSS